MYVGVIPGENVRHFFETGIPHVRGGDPTPNTTDDAFSGVFPMYVGVILLTRPLIMT